MTDQKVSYTQGMLNHLESKGFSDPLMVAAIKDYALQKYDERKAEKASTLGYITFGKYKNKLFSEVAKIDIKYLQWLSKNRTYISAENQVISAK